MLYIISQIPPSNYTLLKLVILQFLYSTMKGTVIAILFMLAILSGANASRVVAVEATGIPPSFPPSNFNLGDIPRMVKCVGDILPAANSCIEHFSLPECCPAFVHLTEDCSVFAGLPEAFDILFKEAIKLCPAAPLT